MQFLIISHFYLVFSFLKPFAIVLSICCFAIEIYVLHCINAYPQISIVCICGFSFQALFGIKADLDFQFQWPISAPIWFQNWWLATDICQLFTHKNVLHLHLSNIFRHLVPVQKQYPPKMQIDYKIQTDLSW